MIARLTMRGEKVMQIFTERTHTPAHHRLYADVCVCVGLQELLLLLMMLMLMILMM
jgi:hypothetical protein